MKFKDLLNVLDSDEQMYVNVEGLGNKGTVEHFRKEELLLDLKVVRVYTRIITDDEYCSNRVSFSTEIDVTLFNDEHFYKFDSYI